jgi:hypothetical protein
VRVDSEKGQRMSMDTPSVPAPSSDLPAAKATGPLTGAVTRDEGFHGDFATGERTEALTQDETADEALHGDFAAGERTEPLTLTDETPGTFGDTEK